jgi:hypothetical protein
MQNTLDPPPNYSDFADNATVTASNLSQAMPPTSCKPLCAVKIGRDQPRHTMAAAARKLFGCPTQQYLNALTIATTHAIADTGATSIFIMEGVDVVNTRIATTPLTINLPDGMKVKLSHVCDIEIPGLPTDLLGHILPSLTVASLIGIHPLCKAGCKVTFDDKKCDVIFDGKVILRGFNDPSTDLWMLPIEKNVRTTPGPNILSPPGPCLGCALHVGDSSESAHPAITLSTFTHSVHTRSNTVKFSH